MKVCEHWRRPRPSVAFWLCGREEEQSRRTEAGWFSWGVLVFEFSLA